MPGYKTRSGKQWRSIANGCSNFFNNAALATFVFDVNNAEHTFDVASMGTNP